MNADSKKTLRRMMLCLRAFAIRTANPSGQFAHSASVLHEDRKCALIFRNLFWVHVLILGAFQ